MTANFIKDIKLDGLLEMTSLRKLMIWGRGDRIYRVDMAGKAGKVREE